MTSFEASGWLQKFMNYDLGFMNKEIIICPSFTLLPNLKSYILDHKSAAKVGGQNISPFDEGAYTGEVNGREIKEFADYVIVGHSERRMNFSEDFGMLEKKVALAKKYNLTPIFCVQGKETQVPEGIEIIAYEPIDAIGTGHPDTPKNADDVASFFKINQKGKYVLYGGSVTSNNVQGFTQMANLDGVLVGKGSLDPLEFLQIIKNA